MVDPLQAITKSQKQALDLLAGAVGGLSDAAGGLARAGKAGVTDPAEAARRMADLVLALGDLAASTTVPMQGLVAGQRELADAMESFAQLQQDLGAVVARIAAGHSKVVDALEALTAPMVRAGEVIKVRKQD